VLKPAEQTPLSALRLGELALEVGFPPGVLNVLTGDGSTGAALVEHPDVDKVAFTGSTAVGREIGAKTGRALKHVTLELGGKSPNIILPDADIEAAVKGSYQAIYFNSGQACNAGSRLFAPAERFDEVLAALAEQAGAARLGPGLDTQTQLGPLVSAEQRDRVLGYIDSGLAEGAELLAGGEAALADSDLRARARRLAVRHARGGRPPRERQRVRACRRRVDARYLKRPPPRRAAARRLGLHKPLGRLRRRRAVRRLQGLGHRPRARPRWARRLSGDQDGLDGPVIVRSVGSAVRTPAAL
jgi:hypothetical protein